MEASWRTVRVFISSTFKDMQAERDHLVRFVFPKLREELLSRYIHLVDVDLRWGITSEQDSLQVCKEIIDECWPRFICMLGGRYGWTPPGHEESITSAEVRYGVLNRLDKSTYAFFYFRDPAATASMVEAQPGEFREPHGSMNEQKLGELKSEIIKAGLNPYVYPATWDQEAGRLSGLEAFGNEVYADLMKSIDEEIGKQLPDKLDEYAEENAAMERFVEERINRYVLGSREGVLNELLAHAGTTSGNGFICLTGPPGSGKSALLSYLYSCLSSRTSGVQSSLIIPHFVGASPGSTNIRNTIRRLCHELKARCSDISAEIPDDSIGLWDAFKFFLKQAAVQNRVIILLDAVNQFDTKSLSELMHCLPRELPPNVRIILSTLNGLVLDELRRHGHSPRMVALDPITEADGEAITMQFTRRYHKHLETEQIQLLLGRNEDGTPNKYDADKPLYLVTVLEELRTLGTHEEITDRIKSLPPGTQGLFLWIFSRLENDDIFRDAKGRMIGKELIPRFISLLALSRFGLSQSELFELFEASDPQRNVAALMYLLRPYLMQRGALINFYHSQILQAVEAMYYPKKPERRKYHEILADYFGSHRNLTNRKVSEWPYQLARSGKWDQLRDAITSPRLCTELSGSKINELWNYASKLPEFKGKLYDIMEKCPDRWVEELGESADYELALNELAFQLSECQEKSAALNIFSRVHKLAQDLYKDDIRTAIRAHNYAACLAMEEHKYKETVDIFRDIIPRFQKEFGKYDERTINARVSLGIAKYKSGDIQNGIDELLSCKADSIQYLGNENVSTAYAIRAVGDAYGFVGDFEGAANNNQDAADILERVFGTDHPHVSATKDNAIKWSRVVELQLQAKNFEADPPQASSRCRKVVELQLHKGSDGSHRLEAALECYKEMVLI